MEASEALQLLKSSAKYIEEARARTTVSIFSLNAPSHTMGKPVPKTKIENNVREIRTITCGESLIATPITTKIKAMTKACRESVIKHLNAHQ
jgi:hypothetical protein